MNDANPRRAGAPRSAPRCVGRPIADPMLRRAAARLTQALAEAMRRTAASARAKAAAPWRALRQTGPALALAATVLAAACAPPSPNPALWRLADSDSEIWLFGTVHILPHGLQWRTPRIDAAFNAAETVVFETDISPAAQPRLTQLFLERGRDPDGRTISMRLDADNRARFARVAAKLGLPAAALEPMRPWFVALQLSALYVMSKGQAPEAGVESVLDAEAQAQNKSRAFLETSEEHIGALANLSEAAETAFLVQTLAEIEEGSDAAIEVLDQAWLRGDTQTLARELNAQIQTAGPEVYRAILTDRNTRWAAQIEAMLAGRGRIFIAVGAAHLVGNDSVVAMLRARGHTIEGP